MNCNISASIQGIPGWCSGYGSMEHSNFLEAHKTSWKLRVRWCKSTPTLYMSNPADHIIRYYFLWQRQQRYLWLAIGNPTRQCGPCTRGVATRDSKGSYVWDAISMTAYRCLSYWHSHNVKEKPSANSWGITIRPSQSQRIQPELKKQKARAPWFDEASAAWLQESS